MLDDDDLNSGRGSDANGSDDSQEDDEEPEKAKPTDGKPEKAKLSKKEKKRLRKKRMDAKMRRFATTVGVEDNENYPKFKDKERLLMNVSNTKYFVIRFAAKHLFNYKLSYKNNQVEAMALNDD